MEGRGLEQLERPELEELGFGPLGVEEVQHSMVRLEDDTGLALRVWGPLGSLGGLGQTKGLVAGREGGGERYPAVLEFLPYRKADYTAPRDHRRHPWLASHGYVVVRADMRGSGDSDGVYHDEYLKQEQDDACELIAWICKQPWSTGKVGMYGKSWGGFNGLQVAARQPQGLAAIISLFSTDDRFEEDIHWKGGCVLGLGMLSWAATMFCWDARPPQPQYRQDWKEVWKTRLEEAGRCCVTEWLQHQTKDAYWQHGSVGLNPEAVQLPVLAIGGWHDAYTRPALRMAHTLPRCRTLVGPWSHNWPDTAVPGPNIGYMDECLGWWDAHLKGSGEMEGPKVRWFQALGVERPGPWVEKWRGHWQQGEASEGAKVVTYSLGPGGRLVEGAGGVMSESVVVPFSGEAGLACGEWLSFGGPDLPADQRRAAPFQAVWTSAVLESETHVFGEAVVTLECSVDKEVAQVTASLCHVFPDGASRLLTYGLLNLCSLEPGRRLRPGELYFASVALDPVGYSLPAGHRLQLLVCPGSWPTSWPSPQPVTLTLGSGSLSLPTLPTLQPVDVSTMFKHPAPRLGPVKQVQQRRPDSYSRDVTYGLSDSRRTLSIRADEGCTYFPDVDTEFDEVATDEYSIKGDDPSTAEAVSTRTCYITYYARSKTPLCTLTETRSVMTSDTDYFHLTNTLITKVDGVDFFTKTWKEKVVRDGV